MNKEELQNEAKKKRGGKGKEKGINKGLVKGGSKDTRINIERKHKNGKKT